MKQVGAMVIATDGEITRAKPPSGDTACYCLEEIQDLLSGASGTNGNSYLEAVPGAYGIPPHLHAYCDEEGALKELPQNALFPGIGGGVVVFANLDSGDGIKDAPLNQEQWELMLRYVAHLKTPGTHEYNNAMAIAWWNNLTYTEREPYIRSLQDGARGGVLQWWEESGSPQLGTQTIRR